MEICGQRYPAAIPLGSRQISEPNLLKYPSSAVAMPADANQSPIPNKYPNTMREQVQPHTELPETGHRLKDFALDSGLCEAQSRRKAARSCACD